MMLLPERSVTTLDTVHCCDALSLLRALPDNYVNCIVTSPPYFGLRNYNVAGQIGLEDTMQAYIARLVSVFREARRVLRDDGVVWCNMGDSYANDGKWGGSTGGKHVNGLHGNSGIGREKKHTGLKPKDIMGIPWRLAFALQDDGWYLRQDIIWHKLNPMPESVTDRCTKSHEYVFLLSKRERYWYDADAIREPISDKWKPATNTWDDRKLRGEPGRRGTLPYSAVGFAPGGFAGHPAGRNRRSVWTVATEATPFAHFATFPQALITPMIQAGCPAQVCSVCGAPYERVTEVEYSNVARGNANGKRKGDIPIESKRFDTRMEKQVTTIGFRPTCDHTDAPSRPGIVLDMFGGSGTTGLVAMRLGRHYIMSDLSSEYVAIARQRLATADPFQDTPISETGEKQLSLFEATT
jgi:DNA modification methylase